MDAEYETQHSQREALIKKFGWVTEHIVPTPEMDRPGYCHTVGLHSLGMPELVVLGMPMEYSRTLMRDLVSFMQSLESPDHFAGRIKLENWELPFYVLEPAQDLVAIDYAPIAALRAGGKAKFLHVSLSDPKGIFPWEAGFDKRLSAVAYLLGPPPVLN